MSLRLKSGTRPPLLLDVLRSAIEIGDAQMIIEIKPGNIGAVDALVLLFFADRPDLIPAIAAIMSFDAHIMHKLKVCVDIIISPN